MGFCAVKPLFVLYQITFSKCTHSRVAWSLSLCCSTNFYREHNQGVERTRQHSVKNHPQRDYKPCFQACLQTLQRFWSRFAGTTRKVGVKSLFIPIILTKTTFSHLPRRHIMSRHIQDCMSATQRMITWLLSVEERPFSLNTHYLADYREKFLAFYKNERQRYSQSGASSSSQPNPESVNEALAALAKLGLTGIKQEDLWKLHRSDQMEPALAIMADVRAYFQGEHKCSRSVITYILHDTFGCVQLLISGLLTTCPWQLTMNWCVASEEMS